MTDVQFVDQILTSLKVIGMIREGQKVCVRNGLINIELRSQGPVASLSRWLHGDNRHTTLSYIRNVVANSIEVSKTYENKRVIWDGLQDALTGLSALTVTYADDATVAATICVLKDRIKTFQDTIKDVGTCVGERFIDGGDIRAQSGQILEEGEHQKAQRGDRRNSQPLQDEKARS